MEDSLRLLKPYLRGLPAIALAMVAGYMIMSQYLNYVIPQYESVTRLRLADITEGTPNSNLFKDFDVFVTSNKIAAEIEILKSEVLINSALDSLDFDVETYRVGQMRTTELYADSPFNVEFISIDSRLLDRLFDLHLKDDLSYSLNHPNGDTYAGDLGDTLELPGVRVSLTLNETFVRSRTTVDIADHYRFKKLSRSSLVSQVKESLTILPVDKDVAVIRLIMASSHPLKAAKFSDALARSYISDYIRVRKGAARITVDFLDEQIDDVNRKLSVIEMQIEAYRNKESITNIQQESETILREVSQMKIQQTNLRMSLEAISELNQYIVEGSDRFDELAPNFEAFTDLLSTELIKKMKELRAQKMDLLLTYTPREERVLVIDEKLDDIRTYFIESITNTRRNLEIKYENLSRDIQVSELRLVDYPEKERLLTILKREFEIYQASYNFLNEKRIEAEIAHSASISFHRIIEHANIPKLPFSPNYVVLKIVASIVSGAMMIVLIFLVHTVKARINDQMTIETTSTLPVVAATPNLKDVASLQKHFLYLVNLLDVKQLLRNGSVVSFNSFTPQEGGAFHALHSAEALSMQGRRVLLIDVENRFGLGSSESVQPQPVTDRLSVAQLSEAAFAFHTQEQVATLIRSLSTGFDLTLIHNAAIGSQLSMQLIGLSDVSLYVVDSRITPARNIPKVDLMIEEFGFKQGYFLLNRKGYNPNLIEEFGFKKASLNGLTYA